MLGLVIEFEDDEEEEAAEEDDGLFAVWPENWESVCLFLACSSQWNVVGLPMGMEMGRLYYVGLSYKDCADVMRDRKIQNRKRAWGDLRVMEASARSALNRKMSERR